MMLAAEVRAALYLARCADCGLQASQSGSRRFDAEIAAAAIKEDAEADATALHLPTLRLGPKSAAILARGVTAPTVINLHGNYNLTDAGAIALLTLLENGTHGLLTDI